MNWKWILFLVLIFFAIPVAASEGFTDNKCYEDWDFCGDGTTDLSQFYWDCGWYVAAYEAGVTNVIPEQCIPLAQANQAQQASSGSGGSQSSYASGGASGQTGGQNPSTQTGGQNPSGQTGDQNPSGQSNGGQQYELITSGHFVGMSRLVDGQC